MGEMIIRLRTDPETGKKHILVELESDSDALPMEHEQQHRALVQKLIEGGILSEDEAGEVVVDRPEPQGRPAAPERRDEDQQQGASEAQGN